MSRRIHVWLLEPGAPAEPGQRDALLRAIAGQPGRLPSWLAWLGPLGAWLWVWWWSRRLLPGPVAPTSAEEAQLRARALGRTLGEAWEAHAVLGATRSTSSSGGEALGVAEAAAHLSTGDRVALVEICPLGGPAATALAAEARAAISGRGGTLLALPPGHEHEGWREAVAETLRSAVADLARNTPYEVLFYVSGLVGNGEGGAAARRLVADLVCRAALARPHHLCFVPGPGVSGGDPGLSAAVARISRPSTEALILVPLNTSDRAELPAVLDAVRATHPDLPLHVAPDPLPRASFVRALGDGLREAAGAEDLQTRPARSA